MATLSAPDVGTVQRVLDIVLCARTWEGNPTLDLFAQFVERFAGTALEQVPAALGECLLPLRLSPPHLRLGLDTIAEFELYEAAPGLVRLLQHDADADGIAAATVVAVHPAADDALRDQILGLMNGLAVTDPHVRELVRVSLAPDAKGDARPFRLAQVRRWPGTASVSQVTTPMVAVAPTAGDGADVLRFLLDLRRAGALVRRIPAEPPSEHLDERWLARWVPVVAARPDEEAWWSRLPHGRVAGTGGRLTPAVRRGIVRRLAAASLPNLRLRLGSDQPASTERLTSPLDDVDAFFSGAFRTHEMAYLTGLKAQTLLSNTKEEPLQPRSRARPYNWPFPTLVGLRVWAYLSGRLERRLKRDIAVQLVRRAQWEHAVPVAVRRDGQVLFHVEDDLYEDAAGQLTPEVFLLQEHVFERFSIGGRHAPRLERPSDHTAVHPEIQGGAPVVHGTRVPAEAVQQLVDSCRRADMSRTDTHLFVTERYPELADPTVIDDATRLGDALVATKLR